MLWRASTLSSLADGRPDATDAEGQVYPDVYDEFEKEKTSDKKKKGKGGKMSITSEETKL